MDGGTLGFLKRHREGRVPALADRLVATILEQNPAYAGGHTVPLADLHRSCHDNIARVLELLASAVDAGWRVADEEDAYFDAARATGRRRAEQGMALDDVLRSFRVGGRLIWEDLVEEARARDALDADGLREVGTRLWEVVDVTSAHVASAYHAAERELVREDEQRRATLWEGLLHGRAKDPVFAREAARILDLPLRGRYVVVALGHQDGAGNVAVALEQRLSLRGMPSAWQRRADCLVGVLTLGAVEPAGVLGLLRERARGPVGVSAVADTLADVDVAHRQAVLALRTIAPGDRALVSFDECLPEALLLSSPDVAERLVRVWLRPLLELPPSERGPLLHTLETWVATGGSATRTAELAHCHRNTVLNRIRRVGSLLGRELAEGSPPVDLALALRAHRLRLAH
jgi:hypothetical protein